MTVSPALVNSGTDFATNDLLPSSDMNKTVSNADLAWLCAASSMGPIVILSARTLSVYPTFPAVTGEVASCSTYSTELDAYEQVFATADGGTTSINITSAMMFGVQAFNSSSQKWYGFLRSLETAWYISSGATMATMTAGTAFSGSQYTTAAIEAGAGTGTVVAVGYSGSDGRIERIIGTTPTLVHSPTGSQYRDVAASSSGAAVVAVSGATVAYSTDNGATWTDASLPSLPAAATGFLSISWSSTYGFIVSGLLTTGECFWSTSSTGASWQAWKKTAQVAVATTAAASYYKGCGICAVGTVLACPYVTAQVTGTHAAGLLLSADGGASWTAIEGKGDLVDYGKLRAVPFGNRIAVASVGAFCASPCLIANDSSNSVTA